MKIKEKYNMTFEEADFLIEKYYEGLTSVEEEKKLHVFLSHSDLPEKYDAEQAIFGYFNPQVRKRPYILNTHLMRWTSVAAVLLTGFFILQLFITNQDASYAYIDGRKITDKSEIKLQAMATLQQLPTGENIVEENIQQVSSKELIKGQLTVFKTFE